MQLRAQLVGSQSLFTLLAVPRAKTLPDTPVYAQHTPQETGGSADRSLAVAAMSTPSLFANLFTNGEGIMMPELLEGWFLKCKSRKD